jgi:hypothetical protein
MFENRTQHFGKLTCFYLRKFLLKLFSGVGGSRVRIPMTWIFFFNLSNPSSRTVTLESTQPLTEMSTMNLPGGTERPARKADLTAICEPIA